MVLSEGGIGAGAITIALREAVTIDRRGYTLGDLAIISADDAGVVERFGGLNVGVSPKPGYVDVITRWDLRQVVEGKVPELRDQIRWGGAETVRLRSVGVSYDLEKIGEIAKNFLYTRFSGEYEQVRIEALGKANTLSLPSGKVEFRPRVDEPLSVRSRMAVWIDVLVEGRHYATLPVWFSVNAFTRVLVAKKDIQRGAWVRREDFDGELRDATSTSGMFPDATANILGYRLKRSIQMGELLLRSNAEALPAISRNQDVTIRVLSGVIEVEGMGTALSDGQLGEVIEVQNSKSREKFKAKVVGAGIVSIGGK